MTYAPSLLIGLGGTGAEVLLRVKKQLQDRGLEDNGLHRFLFIDTDLDTFSTGQGLPSVEKREKCMIGVDDVRDFLDNPDLYPNLRERFPAEKLGGAHISDLSKGRGASQIRSLGAFALALEANRVQNKIEKAYNDLLSLKDIVETKDEDQNAEIKDRVYIYLVGSLAGGTGSGCFLDVALLSKEVCGQDNSELAGMFALPGPFDALFEDPAQKINTRANTYAALKELQFCLDAGREERKELGAIQFNYDNPAQDLELDPEEDRLFDLCFLVDDQSSRGKLSGIEDLYSLMARTIFQDVGSKFGANADSFESNAGVLNGTSPCKKTGLERRFGTVSTSTLYYPASRVADYCTLRSSRSVVKDYLIGTSPTEDTLHNRLSQFLDQHNLEDRGDDNQLLESLLQADSRRSLNSDPEDGSLVSRSWFDLRSDFGEDLSGEEFASRIRDEWERFSNQSLADIEGVVNENRKYRLGSANSAPNYPIRSKLEELALSIAVEHGARAARDILKMVADVAEEMRQEFNTESDDWKRRSEDLERRFNEAADELTQLGSIKSFFSSRDEELKKQLIDLHGERVQGALWEAARPEALQVLEKLKAEAQDVRTSWDALLTNLDDTLLDTLRKNANGLETHSQDEEEFVVEQEVTRPGHEQRYYKQNRLGSGDALAQVLEARYASSDQARAELFRDALRMDPMPFGEKVVIGPLYDHYAPSLADTNVIDFVENHPEEVEENPDEDTLKHKLELQSDLCQPFWPAETVGPIEFPAFKGVSVVPEGIGDDGPVYPTTVSDWADVHGYNEIPSSNRREVVLSRRTYGARAFYLSPCENWKERYERRQETSEGSYMLESHVDLGGIPDLFPKDDIRPLRYFAIGIALGFIVQRGEWYYFGLQRPPFEEGKMYVLYEQQDWPTVHSIDSTSPPPTAGKLDFTERQDNVDKDLHQLAQGRENAIEALGEEEEYLDLLEGAIQEYHQSVGNRIFYQQLDKYQKQVLDSTKVTGNNVFAREKRQIRKRLDEIHP
ncbi:MAG: tubulin-like doman-containing protein [Salinibacter sp.]